MGMSMGSAAAGGRRRRHNLRLPGVTPGKPTRSYDHKSHSTEGDERRKGKQSPDHPGLGRHFTVAFSGLEIKPALHAKDGFFLDQGPARRTIPVRRGHGTSLLNLKLGGMTDMLGGQRHSHLAAAPGTGGQQTRQFVHHIELRSALSAYQMNIRH